MGRSATGPGGLGKSEHDVLKARPETRGSAALRVGYESASWFSREYCGNRPEHQAKPNLSRVAVEVFAINALRVRSSLPLLGLKRIRTLARRTAGHCWRRLTSELIASNRRKWQVEAVNQRLVSWLAMQRIQFGIAEHDDSHHPFIERSFEEIERGLGNVACTVSGTSRRAQGASSWAGTRYR